MLMGHVPHMLAYGCFYPFSTQQSVRLVKRMHETWGRQQTTRRRVLFYPFGMVLIKTKRFLCKITYLLTPWCRVLLEKLTGLQLIKKFPAFHGTRRVITAITSVCHLSLSWASPIQSLYTHPTSWRSILILSTHLRLGLPSGVRLLF